MSQIKMSLNNKKISYIWVTSLSHGKTDIFLSVSYYENKRHVPCPARNVISLSYSQTCFSDHL